jgi:chromate transporter
MSTLVAGAKTQEEAVTFGEALRFWFKLGFISFGGPAGQIAIMHRELVEERRWISEERFLHALNFCMLLPGPEAQQLAIYIGWLKHRTVGGVAAGVLFVLPGFLLITVVSAIYVTFSNWSPMQGVLFGLKAAVLAVVLEAVVRIARRALKDRLSWFIAAGAFVGIFALAIPFPVIVLGAALVGFFAERRRPPLLPQSDLVSTAAGEVNSAPKQASALASGVRILTVCLVLWFAPLLLIYATLGSSHVLMLEGVFFSKMAVVTFGGAYAVLAYVAQEAVQHYEWLTPADMMQGLALAETTPGPLILVLTFVGFVAAFRDAAPFDPMTAGVLGALLTTWVTFVPCFLWILLGAPHLERLRSKRALSAALASVTAAVVGVILNLAVWFALHALFAEVSVWRGFGLQIPIPAISSIDYSAVAIASAAIIALLKFKAPMIPTLAMCAAAGLVFRVM